MHGPMNLHLKHIPTIELYRVMAIGGVIGLILSFSMLAWKWQRSRASTTESAQALSHYVDLLSTFQLSLTKNVADQKQLLDVARQVQRAAADGRISKEFSLSRLQDIQNDITARQEDTDKGMDQLQKDRQPIEDATRDELVAIRAYEYWRPPVISAGFGFAIISLSGLVLWIHRQRVTVTAEPAVDGEFEEPQKPHHGAKAAPKHHAPAHAPA